MLPDYPSPVLFEDEDTLVVSKPVGIAVHRSDIIDPREEVLLPRLRKQLGYRLYPVHRLDRATSGVLIFGKTSAAAAYLSQEWQAGRVKKIYLAVCRGWPPERLRIEKPLTVLDAPDKEPQLATTRLERIASILWSASIETYPESRLSLLALYPETGRRHQLRRHLAQINHPLIGDTTYGRGAYNRYFRTRFHSHRLLLHHRSLSWMGKNGEQLSVSAPWDEAWETIMQTFEWFSNFHDWESMSELDSSHRSRNTLTLN